MGRLYAHWRDVGVDDWPWPFFEPSEIASKGDGSILVVPEALDRLVYARKIVGKPFLINSAYRDPLHNARVGGSAMSRHKFGDAFDISLRGHNRMELLAACKRAGFRGFGGYNTFLHIDLGRKRKWGKKWVF